MLSKGTEQNGEQDAKQGAGLSTDLFLANSRSLTITKSCVNVSKCAVSKRTEWAATLQVGKSIQMAKVKNSCIFKI